MKGPPDCDCYCCHGKDTGHGEEPCEYYNHHCDACHDNKRCTDDNCLIERSKDEAL